MLPPLPPDIDAVIFDLDGTLLDTMPTHLRAWQRALRELGGDITEQEFYECAGMPTQSIIRLLNERHGRSLSVEGAAVLKESYFFEMMEGITPKKPVVDLLHLARMSHGVAVATGGERYVAQQSLARGGLAHLFEVIVTADDVLRGKPDPEMFLQAARLLRTSAARCVVVEDGASGVEAARRAGMRCIDLREYGLA